MASQVAWVVKNLPANAGDIRDAGSIPGSGRYPVVGSGNHSSILAWRIPMDRGAWWATVHRVTKSQTRLKQLSMHMHPDTAYFNFRMNASANADCRPVTCENWTAENCLLAGVGVSEGRGGVWGASWTCRLILKSLLLDFHPCNSSDSGSSTYSEDFAFSKDVLRKVSGVKMEKWI